MRYIGAIALGALLIVAPILGCQNTQRGTSMAATITRLYQPPETVDYDPLTGEVVIVRQYEARGSYPVNTLALGRTDTESGTLPATYADVLPSMIVASVYKDPYVTYPPAGIVSVPCYIATIHSESHVAKSDESLASTLLTVTYKGYTTGVVSHDFDISTESSLQKVNLDFGAVDLLDRPQGIGAKGEGTNKLIPKGQWRIVQNVYGDELNTWLQKYDKITTLTGTVNEDNWLPNVYRAGEVQRLMKRGDWLYLGAVKESLTGPYYRLVHTFLPYIAGTDNPDFPGVQFYKWREETQVEEDAPVATGVTAKRLKTSYGPEQTSQIYVVAGENNHVAGRDLSLDFFADLGL